MPHSILKVVGMVIVALVLASIAYATWISLTHWHGIGV